MDGEDVCAPPITTTAWYDRAGTMSWRRGLAPQTAATARQGGFLQPIDTHTSINQVTYHIINSDIDRTFVFAD